jgi:hypothetical protein
MQPLRIGQVDYLKRAGQSFQERFTKHRKLLVSLQSSEAFGGFLHSDRTTRTYFSYRIDVWTNDGESIVEHLAGGENLIVARAAYRAACKRWPKAVITLRRGARIVEGTRHWPT